RGRAGRLRPRLSTVPTGILLHLGQVRFRRFASERPRPGRHPGPVDARPGARGTRDGRGLARTTRTVRIALMRRSSLELCPFPVRATAWIGCLATVLVTVSGCGRSGPMGTVAVDPAAPVAKPSSLT